MTAAERIRARRDILTCRRCLLAEGCRRPVPWSGPVPNRLLVVGEAPGRQEDTAGKPFVGPAGKLLRRLMAEVGIDPDGLAWANTVACFPHRTPNSAEVEACSVNLFSIIAAVRPVHVLLVGGVALSVWRSDLRITQAHGKPFMVGYREGYWREPFVAYPVLHPAAALRDPGLTASIRKDLEAWTVHILHDGPVAWSEECARCGGMVERYDPDGIPWCGTHRVGGISGYGKVLVARRQLGKVGSVQEVMAI